MLLLDRTCATAALNLALDEALLEEAEANESVRRASATIAAENTEGASDEVLRFWESPSLAVVLGRGCRAQDEVDLTACQRDGVPVLRRPSGGGTVLIGPGSLMYTLVLSSRRRPELRSIDMAHRTVLGRHVAALQSWLPTVRLAGTSDLTIDLSLDGRPEVRKFSGNSLRVRRDWILYHGTLLYDFALGNLARYLRPPPRQPDYRVNREHADFVTNAPLAAESLRAVLAQAWQASRPLVEVPAGRIARLASEKYDRDEWNLQF